MKKPILKKKKRETVSKETYETVLIRDNYSCRLCGSTYWLVLHHIVYRSEDKTKINDVDNCIMLCKTCHDLVHSDKRKYQPILLKNIKKEPSR